MLIVNNKMKIIVNNKMKILFGNDKMIIVVAKNFCGVVIYDL